MMNSAERSDSAIIAMNPANNGPSGSAEPGERRAGPEPGRQETAPGGQRRPSAPEGPHVDGGRHGPWRIAHPDGSVEEGGYAEGRLHGEWTLRGADGAIMARELWCHGRSSSSGKAVCE